MLDPSRLHEWVTIHRKINRADSGEPREGFEMDQTLCLRHANFKVHWTLTDAERPHRATWEGRGPAGSYARTSYTLTPNGDGTHFEYENEFKPPGGIPRPRRLASGRRRAARARSQTLTGTTQSTPRTLTGNVPCGDFPRSGIPCESRSPLPWSHTQMADFLDEKRKEIQARLNQLRPAVEEYELLKAADEALGGLANGAPKSTAVSGRRRLAGRKRAAGGGARRGRPRGGGTRAAQALELVKNKPGITIPELAEAMGIQQNYLYRVMPGLAEEGKVTKSGRGWHLREGVS